MNWTEREGLRQLTRDRSRWSAEMAEMAGSQSIADIVSQQRRRGRIATTSTRWLLVALIVTIFFGLIFYLGQPFWEQFVDGRRNSLIQTIQNHAATTASLDARAEEQAADLVAALQDSFEVLEIPNKASLWGHVELDDGLLFYGDDGTLFRANRDGSVPEDALIATPNAAWLRGHVALDDGLLFYGEGGTLFRANRDGSVPEDALIDTPNEAWLYGALDH